MQDSTVRVLIIGYGNPLRGDDGVGRLVASELESLFEGAITVGDIEVITAHQLTPELAETVSGFELAVFVDACCDRDAGVVCRMQVEPATVDAMEGMTHQLDPATLLGYAKSLYGSTPEALFYTIGGYAFEFEESISRPVKHAVQFAVEDISEIVLRRCPGIESAHVLIS